MRFTGYPDPPVSLRRGRSGWNGEDAAATERQCAASPPRSFQASLEQARTDPWLHRATPARRPECPSSSSRSRSQRQRSHRLAFGIKTWRVQRGLVELLSRTLQGVSIACDQSLLFDTRPMLVRRGGFRRVAELLGSDAKKTIRGPELGVYDMADAGLELGAPRAQVCPIEQRAQSAICHYLAAVGRLASCAERSDLCLYGPARRNAQPACANHQS